MTVQAVPTVRKCAEGPFLIMFDLLHLLPGLSVNRKLN